VLTGIADVTQPPKDDPPITDHPTIDSRDLLTQAPSQAPLSADNAPGWTPGSRLGRYRMVRELGRGGFGHVWEAESDDGRRIALKVLTAARAATGEILERFRREGRLAASIHHPRCVAILGAEELDGLPAIAMELMPGGTLQDRLDRDGPLPYRDAVDATLQMIDGLEAAHEQGIAHRDIKPSNCFVDADGSVKIGDFGLSKTLDTDVSLTATGSFLGTPHYASPEQVRGRDVDHRSDMYSVAATLYALITARPPHGGTSATEALARILAEPPAPIDVPLPRGLERTLLRGLAKDPGKRFSTYVEMRQALKPFSSQGLGGADMGRRVVAILADEAALIIIGIAGGISSVLSGGVGERAFLLATMMLARFLYFFLCEWRFGRTAGKALLGLRVATVQGDVAGARSILVRTLVYEACRSLPSACATAIILVVEPAAMFDDSMSRTQGLMALLGVVLLALTMRRKNGWAGLHELLSGTRVRTISRVEVAVLPRPATVAELAPEAAEGRTLGPFRIARERWRDGDQAVSIGRDEALERDVWIHEDSAVKLGSESTERPLELRWLQGGRDGERGFNVYSLAPGRPLTEWIRETGGLGWGETRTILLDLARQLAGRPRTGGGGAPLSLEHVWIDARGHATLLEFSLDRQHARPPRPLDDWPGFVRDILRACASDSTADGMIPDMPFPEHARTTVEGIMHGRFATSAELVAILETQMSRPARLSRRRRLGPALVIAGLTVLVPVAATALFWFSFRLLDLRALELAGTASAAELKRIDGQLVTDEQRTAIETLLSAQYTEVLALDDPITTSILQKMKAETRLKIRQARMDHPRVSPAERAEAARIAAPLLREEQSDLREMRGLTGLRKVGWATTRAAVLGVCFLGFPALLLALAMRVGPLQRIFGMELRTRTGRRAGRVRALVRVVVAWLPGLLLALAFVLTSVDFDAALPLLALVVVITTAGASLGAVRPRWSIPDRVAGTRLVPR